MEIHICDTSLIPAHACCGDFTWPEEIRVLCGKTVAFQPLEVALLDSDEEKFCQGCLHTLRTRTARQYKSICTVAG
jgi:hypothetical protein